MAAMDGVASASALAQARAVKVDRRNVDFIGLLQGKRLCSAIEANTA